MEPISLELEFSLIKKIYKDLQLAKTHEEVTIIFDKHLSDKLFLWTESPYVFDQFYSRLLESYYSY
jgi:hypothetical protein